MEDVKTPETTPRLQPIATRRLHNHQTDDWTDTIVRPTQGHLLA